MVFNQSPTDQSRIAFFGNPRPYILVTSSAHAVADLPAAPTRNIAPQLPTAGLLVRCGGRFPEQPVFLSNSEGPSIASDLGAGIVDGSLNHRGD